MGAFQSKDEFVKEADEELNRDLKESYSKKQYCGKLDVKYKLLILRYHNLQTVKNIYKDELIKNKLMIRLTEIDN